MKKLMLRDFKPGDWVFVKTYRYPEGYVVEILGQDPSDGLFMLINRQGSGGVRIDGYTLEKYKVVPGLSPRHLGLHYDWASEITDVEKEISSYIFEVQKIPTFIYSS